MKKHQHLLLISNVNYIINEYINKLIKTNKNYHFEFLYGDEDVKEEKLQTHLMIASFFAEKKFIVLRKYLKLKKETLKILSNSHNRVLIVVNDETKFVKELIKMDVFLVKNETYKSLDERKLLLKNLTKSFVFFEEKNVNYLAKMFDDPNELVQQMRLLSLWKDSITYKEIVKFYVGFDKGEVFQILSLFFNRKTKDFYRLMNKINSEQLLNHFFNYLALIIKDLSKLKYYEDIGYVANALPVGWFAKKLYESMENKDIIYQLVDWITNVEKDRKFNGIQLTKNYLLNSLLVLRSENEYLKSK